MSAPSSAKRTACDRPWPRAAPVMKATFPSNCVVALVSLSLVGVGSHLLRSRRQSVDAKIWKGKPLRSAAPDWALKKVTSSRQGAGGPAQQADPQGGPTPRPICSGPQLFGPCPHALRRENSSSCSVFGSAVERSPPGGLRPPNARRPTAWSRVRHRRGCRVESRRCQPNYLMIGEISKRWSDHNNY